MTAIIAGMRVVGEKGEGILVEGGAGVRGAAPAGPGPPDCHETDLRRFMNKLCHEIRHDL